jgi:hypothetical protein
LPLPAPIENYCVAASPPAGQMEATPPLLNVGPRKTPQTKVASERSHGPASRGEEKKRADCADTFSDPFSSLSEVRFGGASFGGDGRETAFKSIE